MKPASDFPPDAAASFGYLTSKPPAVEAAECALVRRTECWWLVLILLLAVGLRVGFVCWIESRLQASGESFFLPGDAEGYWALGLSLARGDEYAVHAPPRRVHRMPGFPLLLAASIKLFGESLFAARLLLATLGGLSCLLVYLVGRRLHSSAVGLLAAALWAIWPTAIVFSGVLLSEMPFAVALLLTALSTLRLRDVLAGQHAHPTNRSQLPRLLLWGSVTGLSLALGVFFKPSWILAAPLLGMGLCLLQPPRGRSAVASCLIVAMMVVALLPWGVRNQRVSGHFTLTTFWMGPSLYDGLHPAATGTSDMRFFDEEQLPLQFSEYEVDRIYRRRAFEFARQQPLRAVSLAVAKQQKYWSLAPGTDQLRHPLLRWGVSGLTLFAWICAAWGAWEVRREIWYLVICLGPVFYFAGIHTLFVGSLRYRLPAESLVMILTAIGICSGLRYWRDPRHRN